MPNIGPMELAIVLVIALIVLGPKRLPEVGRSLGRGIREFKDSIGGDSDDERADGEQEPKVLAQTAATATTAPPEPAQPGEPVRPAAQPAEPVAPATQTGEPDPAQRSGPHPRF
jgi:sec-independent protein translocase protein TatA